MTAKPSGQLDPIPFEQALMTALTVAASSPSSHNCQPWAVARVTGLVAGGAATSEFVVLALDRSRALSALSAHDAEMRISCGLYWQLFKRTLAAQGWSARSLTPALELPTVLPGDWEPLRLSEFRRGAHTTEALADLKDVASARHTNRGPYRPVTVPPTTLAELGQVLRSSGTSIETRYLLREDELDRFSDFVKQYGGYDFSHRRAWKETYSFIHRNAAEAAEHGDGFTLAHLFGPLNTVQNMLRRTALAPHTMRALKFVGFPQFLAGRLARVVRTAPVVVMLSLAESDRKNEDLINAGQRLCDYWLAVTRAGLVLHPISIVVQHDHLRTELVTRFELDTPPFFVARLGFPTVQFPPSPRRVPGACFREL
ncbi:hypothetical protein [Nocardia sp. NPDC050435]|uniref:hypothetical protein n=1 Tax=Nocardia sp. NPDC050435 TaxID=3155040 RepID=UPI003401374D